MAAWCPVAGTALGRSLVLAFHSGDLPRWRDVYVAAGRWEQLPSDIWTDLMETAATLQEQYVEASASR